MCITGYLMELWVTLFAGCGKAHNYIYAQEHQADVILRITPKNFCLHDMDGNKISLVQLLKEAEKRQEKMVDIFWFCKYSTKTAFGRIIAGKGETVNCSLYKKCKISFFKIKEILCLPWEQFINFTDKKYSRYLSRKKQYRKNQNNEFHTAILPGLPA